MAPILRAVLEVRPHSAEQSRQPLPSPTGSAGPGAPQGTVGLLCCQRNCCLTFSLLPVRTPRALSAGLISNLKVLFLLLEQGQERNSCAHGHHACLRYQLQSTELYCLGDPSVCVSAAVMNAAVAVAQGCHSAGLHVPWSWDRVRDLQGVSCPNEPPYPLWGHSVVREAEKGQR